MVVQEIQARCQKEGWYGPADFKQRRAAWARPFSFTTGFAFPPATQEQLQETEHLLGFPLPPLLRTLYMTLANGGFGPGAGIRGALGGYGMPDTFENGNDETILKRHALGESLIDLDQAPWQSEGTRSLNLPVASWPTQLAPLCDMGCQQEICINSKGTVFLWYPSEEDDSRCTLLDQGITLEEWLWRWLGDDR